MELDRPWNVPVRVEEVPETGLAMHLCADNDIRERIARIADVLALPRLEADFMITRRGRGLHVAGEVSATVAQTCVVTLDPIENRIIEPVDLVFEPAADGDLSGPARGEPEGEPPEPLQGGCVDLGALATEFLLLGIDPYPRKPGATFAPPAAAAATEGPFAALAALKRKRNEGGR
ncbi:MAG: YceD family protein [Xanthobacteraceae bacterium]